MKVELLQDAVLKVKKGSIVEVDDRQFELARRILKPVDKQLKEEPKVVETAEEPKEKKSKKK